MDPIYEMFEMLSVVRQFEEAVENNLVMDFEEYVRRFGSGFDSEPAEETSDFPCDPFVYVGDEYAGSGYSADRIVADSCIWGHNDIISVYGEYSEFGYPSLYVGGLDTGTDDSDDDGYIHMWLEWVSCDDSEDPIDMTRQANINRSTGEVIWV